MKTIAMILALFAAGCGPDFTPPTWPDFPPPGHPALTEWAHVTDGALTCDVHNVIPGQATLASGDIYCVWTCARWEDGASRLVQVWFTDADGSWQVKLALGGPLCTENQP